ncbi:MAG TPA: GyrI-like domain-containing protein [Chitinophagaceae bacterium]|nr:GyrI-like domain-containing protein [Chitinophagaceae bacterium]
MKKILIGLVLAGALLLGAVYLFIPGKMKISAGISVHAALPGVSRSLFDSNNWKKFWPAKTPFKMDDQEYLIKGKFFNAFNIDIVSEKDTLSSIINLLLIRTESITVDWSSEQITSSNPFKRFVQYRQAIATEENMKQILNSLKEFMEQTRNIYGFDIRQTIVTDSALISTRRVLEHEPTLKDIDEMIQSLKKYIAENKAIGQNLPMLNVLQLDSSRYEVMTAIPVDRQLPLTNDFAPKFLLKGGKILEGEITGGPKRIEMALKELENYRLDYKFPSPAKPYQLLLTDRLKEPDTTKWVTRLYYPVF